MLKPHIQSLVDIVRYQAFWMNRNAVSFSPESEEMPAMFYNNIDLEAEIAELNAEIEFDPAKLQPIEDLMPELAKLIEAVQIEQPETPVRPSIQVSKVDTAAWRPDLTPESIIEMELAQIDKRMFRIVVSTRREVGQFKIAAISDWDLMQAGRALAQADYWSFEHTFSKDGSTWNVMRHRYEDRQIAVSLDKSNFFVMEKRGNGRWKTHPMTSPGLHVTRAAGMFWVYGETRKNSSKLAQAGGMFKYNSPLGMPAWGFRTLPNEIAAICALPRWTKYHMLAALLLGNRLTVLRIAFSAAEAYAHVEEGYRRELWRIAGFDWREFPRPVFGVKCPACGQIKNGFHGEVCVDCHDDMAENIALLEQLAAEVPA